MISFAFNLICSVAMFRNQYDTDVTVWSPQGRFHQVEYAQEAVNQVYLSCGIFQITFF